MIYASRFLRLMDPPMTGPDVKTVHESLAKLGYYSGAIDGVYGQTTAEAVKSFQSAVGISSDGIVGPDTWNALGLSVGPVTINRAYRITVDTQSLKLTLSKNGAVQAVYPVAVGKSSTPTPIGDWIINGKQVNPGGPFGARWMRLNVPWGGYGIHGTDNPSSIGTQASHGCVRMYNDGYYKGDIDGVYGVQTRDAVIEFQKAKNLTADGIVGPATYEDLEKMYDTVLGLRNP